MVFIKPHFTIQRFYKRLNYRLTRKMKIIGFAQLNVQ